MLARNPRMGSLRPDFASAPVRFWLVPPYWLIYDSEQGVILRMIDARRDIASQGIRAS